MFKDSAHIKTSIIFFSQADSFKLVSSESLLAIDFNDLGLFLLLLMPSFLIAIILSSQIAIGLLSSLFLDLSIISSFKAAINSCFDGTISFVE